MIVLMVLLFSQVITCQSSQKSESLEINVATQNLRKTSEGFLAGKVQSDRSNSENRSFGDQKNSKRKSKSLGFYPPYFLHQLVPYGLPAGYHHQQSKDSKNSYPAEWLSRTEPFKKSPPLLDSPTYYIRLPPNPYAYVPGLGYVSRPSTLSDPEVFEGDKQGPGAAATEEETGNDLFQDLFYRVPINFVSNGKPTSVYQLSAGEQGPGETQTNFLNLNKGPYVFNGKPNEILLVAQIYNALYGDELDHFYP